jgi:hypothetical protein
LGATGALGASGRGENSVAVTLLLFWPQCLHVHVVATGVARRLRRWAADGERAGVTS